MTQTFVRPSCRLLWGGVVVFGVLTLSPLAGQGGYPAARTGANDMHNYYFPPAPSSTPWAPVHDRL